MGLLGKILSKPATVRGAAMALDDARMNRIKAVEQSGLIRFIPNQELPFSDGELPITFFSLPNEPKLRQLIHETAAKNVKKEDIPRVAEGELLFVIADSVFGNASNGLLAMREGVFTGSLSKKFIPKEEIDSFGEAKGWMFIQTKDGTKHSPPVMSAKKIKERVDDFLTLFRSVYC